MVDHSDWARVRALRADPPGEAASDRRRRATFGAALEQSEELLEAAAAVGPAARPILLFYALSQGSRAICAARGDEPDPHGHGLSHRMSGSNVLRCTVRPEGGERTLFQAVARTIHSNALTSPVALGALWSALSDHADVDLPGRPPDWRRPLLVELHPDARKKRMLTGGVQVHLIGLPRLDAPGGVAAELAHYPKTKNAVLTPSVLYRDRKGRGLLTYGFWRNEGGGQQLHDRLATFERVFPPDPHGRRWLLPGLGDSGDEVSPLIVWWALLLGLSSLARYEPATWVKALDVDRSAAAVPLEIALESALAAIPALLLAALTEDS